MSKVMLYSDSHELSDRMYVRTDDGNRFAIVGLGIKNHGTGSLVNWREIPIPYVPTDDGIEAEVRRAKMRTFRGFWEAEFTTRVAIGHDATYYLLLRRDDHPEVSKLTIDVGCGLPARS